MSIYTTIPTWDNGTWTTTDFSTREDFKVFVTSLFKEPGKYDFGSTSLLFNEQAKKFHTDKVYCIAPVNSKDFFNYWGKIEDEYILSEKSKCRRGVIYKDKGKTFYLPRDYYFWINFLPIYDKENKKYDFPQVWDSQYHTALYELLAELNYKHVALLKKRQWGNSYFHMSKILNKFWFEDGVTLKIGASLKDYINEKGDWKFLNEYRNFLNKNTGWYRSCDPDKVLMWQQRQKISVGSKDAYKGNMSTITGTSFEKDPTASVGGAVEIFYHEEAGIAAKMATTYEYIRPALATGMITTGLFIAAGSVGDLDQCQPLKYLILNPDSSSIYSVETDLLDDKGTIGRTGLFIPEQWSMPPYIDKYGNSIILTPTEEQDKDILQNWKMLGLDMKDYRAGRGSLEAIKEQRAKWKLDGIEPATYQLRVSQKPINIYEAFAYRKDSPFPMSLVNKQIQRIEDKEYFIEYVDIERNTEGRLKMVSTNKWPITEFPIRKSMDDKTGVICVHERPIKETPDFGTYIASIDPVREGKVTSSDSLCSIYIYRTDSEVSKIQGHDIEHYLDRGKIVAWWCGRFDDITDTHERLENMLEIYNARAICEVNVSEFVTYLKNKKKQHWLITRSQLLSFTKDQKGVSETYQEYGWKNNSGTFQHLLAYGINFLKEKLDEETDQKTGKVYKTVYGIERIPDIMLLREMAEYQHEDKRNFDRLISYVALVTFVTLENADRGFRKRVEKIADLENPNKFAKFLMGDTRPKKPNPWSKPGGAFRNFR